MGDPHMCCSAFVLSGVLQEIPFSIHTPLLSTLQPFIVQVLLYCLCFEVSAASERMSYQSHSAVWRRILTALSSLAGRMHCHFNMWSLQISSSSFSGAFAGLNMCCPPSLQGGSSGICQLHVLLSPLLCACIIRIAGGEESKASAKAERGGSRLTAHWELLGRAEWFPPT